MPRKENSIADSIATDMHSIMESDQHRSFYAKPSVTAMKHDDDDDKKKKKEKEKAKKMKEDEKAKAKKEKEDKKKKKAKDKAACLTSLQNSIKGVAKISELLDEIGFEKSALSALRTLGVIVSEAQGYADDKEKDDKKDDDKKDKKDEDDKDEDDKDKKDDKKDDKDEDKNDAKDSKKKDDDDDDKKKKNDDDDKESKKDDDDDEDENDAKDGKKGKMPPWLKKDDDDDDGDDDKKDKDDKDDKDDDDKDDDDKKKDENDVDAYSRTMQERKRHPASAPNPRTIPGGGYKDPQRKPAPTPASAPQKADDGAVGGEYDVHPGDSNIEQAFRGFSHSDSNNVEAGEGFLAEPEKGKTGNKELEEIMEDLDMKDLGLGGSGETQSLRLLEIPETEDEEEHHSHHEHEHKHDEDEEEEEVEEIDFEKLILEPDFDADIASVTDQRVHYTPKQVTNMQTELAEMMKQWEAQQPQQSQQQSGLQGGIVRENPYGVAPVTASKKKG